MLSIFQTELPIGRQLWTILLALAFTGHLAEGPLALDFDQPLGFLQSILIYYGFVMAWAFVIHLLLQPLARHLGDTGLEPSGCLPNPLVYWPRLFEFSFTIAAFVAAFGVLGQYLPLIGRAGLAVYVTALVIDREMFDVFQSA